MTASRAPKRTILPLACALLAATSGCSFLFMEKVSTGGEPARAPHCTPNNGTVFVDAIFGTAYLASGIEGMSDPEDEDERGPRLFSAALGAVMVVSAILHIGEAEKCRRAIHDHNAWIMTGAPR